MTLFIATILHLAPFLTAQEHPASFSLRAFFFPSLFVLRNRVDHGVRSVNQIVSMCLPGILTYVTTLAQYQWFSLFSFLPCSFTRHEFARRA